jgi:hypothetical protein
MSANPENKGSEQVAVPERVENKYAILQETSGEECESWYYFIKSNGNEDTLNHLKKQLDSVDWYILGDLSTFDLETSYLVSENTAREMTLVDLNHTSRHRKFDGVLKKIDLGFKDTHSNEKKMNKAFDILSYGKIDEYIDGEDIDPSILVDGSEEESSSESSEEESSSESSEEEKTPPKKEKGKPKEKIEIPRFAKAKAKKRH